MTDVRVVKKISLASLCCMAAFLLVGCEFQPRVLSAHAHRVGDNEAIEVKVSSSDAAKIKNRQLYFSMAVTSCEGAQSHFPVEPYIDGRRASEFDFATAGDDIKITGSMPVSIFEKYDRPCVVLRGGSYLGGKLKSASVPITTGKRD